MGGSEKTAQGTSWPPPDRAEMGAAGEIKIVGAIYSLETGEVRWLY